MDDFVFCVEPNGDGWVLRGLGGETPFPARQRAIAAGELTIRLLQKSGFRARVVVAPAAGEPEAAGEPDAEILPHPEILSHPEILPRSEILPRPGGVGLAGSEAA